MATARIHDLLRLGPNERIVFERTVLSPESIARSITSLANTNGGTVIIGVDERRRVHGVSDPRSALAAINRAAQIVTPALLIEPHVVVHDGKELIVLDVPQGYDTPYIAADKQIVVRRGSKTAVATPDHAAELARRAVTNATLTPVTQRLQPKNVAPTPAPTIDIEHILLKLERLILTNAELSRKLDQANSWRSRITDQLIGAMLGMLISLAVFYVLGIG